MKSQNHSRLMHDYEERVRSLLFDGYVLVHITQLNDGGFTKLKHRSNQNVVIVSAHGGYLTQKTNGIIVHHMKYE